MKRLLIILSLSLCCATAFPQREGFFNVYEQADKSFCPSAAIETEDSCLIIAVFDYYGGRGELKKLSKDGVYSKDCPSATMTCSQASKGCIATLGIRMRSMP